MVIAIDGPSGSGKTSTAKRLSERLNFYYCDSGSLYRAITYYLIDSKIDLDNELKVFCMIFDRFPSGKKLIFGTLDLQKPL